MIQIDDFFYDSCQMEADGKGTFYFFDDDLTVPMTGEKKAGNWNDPWLFSSYTSFDVSEEFEVDLDRLIIRGFKLEELEQEAKKDDGEDPYYPKYNAF